MSVITVRIELPDFLIFFVSELNLPQYQIQKNLFTIKVVFSSEFKFIFSRFIKGFLIQLLENI